MRTLASEISVRFGKVAASPCLDSLRNALKGRLSSDFLALTDFYSGVAAV